tara:strand:- start:17 stop:196 length:180 start_codon:yes stop_codon:yes gene_type:complete
MNKLNSFNDSSFEKKHSNVKNLKIKRSENQYEKVLCDHCGRTSSNGVGCLGICVADNDY